MCQQTHKNTNIQEEIQRCTKNDKQLINVAILFLLFICLKFCCITIVHIADVG